ncbi:MAG: MBL fold metallo-hydrolase [Ekhidna sp.]
MKYFFLSLSLLFSLLTMGQISSPDKMETNNGDLRIQPIVHGSLVLIWDRKVIYVDPYGGAERFEGLNNPDIVLITDIHGDHLNQKTLDRLELNEAKFFVPKAVYEKLPDDLQKRATIISNGGSEMLDGINIEAIPMYNLPEDETSRHTKGRGNGYILTMGGKRVYISGDTEDVPEMRNLENIDLAFVCMNLPYTMDINQAANAVNEFKPSVVYPYHFRGKDGLADVSAFKSMVNSENPEIEVRLKNWYPK